MSPTSSTTATARRRWTGLAGFFAYGASLTDEAAGERVQGLARNGQRLRGPRRTAATRPPAAAERRATGRRPRRRADRSLLVAAVRRRSRHRRPTDSAQRRRVRRDRRAGAADFVTPVRDVEFVMPFSPDHDPRRGARNSFNFIIGAGRLRAGASVSQAASELDGIARRLQQQFPVENARKRGVQMVRRHRRHRRTVSHRTLDDLRGRRRRAADRVREPGQSDADARERPAKGHRPPARVGRVACDVARAVPRRGADRRPGGRSAGRARRPVGSRGPSGARAGAVASRRRGPG